MSRWRNLSLSLSLSSLLPLPPLFFSLFLSFVACIATKGDSRVREKVEVKDVAQKRELN